MPISGFYSKGNYDDNRRREQFSEFRDVIKEALGLYASGRTFITQISMLNENGESTKDIREAIKDGGKLIVEAFYTGKGNEDMHSPFPEEIKSKISAAIEKINNASKKAGYKDGDNVTAQYEQHRFVAKIKINKPSLFINYLNTTEIPNKGLQK